MTQFKFGRRYVKPLKILDSKSIGLEILRRQRELVVNRWSELGLLEGLEGNIPINLAQIFESQSQFIINEKLEKDDIPFKFR